ncbi:MAG: NUDIX domain-containing protein [Bdellovibrionota bacterium]
MKLIPVSLALFYRQPAHEILEVWVQTRTDDGIYHGLLEFPGGGIEQGETPLVAAVREVMEEVGINIKAEDSQFMGIYRRTLPEKAILLYLHLFPEYPGLEGKGQWLKITREKLSSPYEGKIPGPNHLMIDDLYRYLYDERV